MIKWLARRFSTPLKPTLTLTLLGCGFIGNRRGPLRNLQSITLTNRSEPNGLLAVKSN